MWSATLGQLFELSFDNVLESEFANFLNGLGSLYYLRFWVDHIEFQLYLGLKKTSFRYYTRVLYMKTNTDHTNNSILFETYFDEPIESTVGSRGRRNWIKLPISDAIEMRRLIVLLADDD